MVFDITTAIIETLVIGGFGGFVNSVAAWLSGTEAFSTRKNIKAILTGVITGLALGVAAIAALTADMTFQTLVVTLAMVFLSAVGVDQLTSRVSGMVTQRAVTSLSDRLATK